MRPSTQAEMQTEAPEWCQGQDAELAGSKILAHPYPGGAQARGWREGWTASARTAPRRYASGLGGYTSRFPESLPPPEEPPVSAVIKAVRVGIRSERCPVCGGAKVREAMFCVRCRGFLPRGAFLVLATLGREEDRARWWQQACADLRGE